MPKYQYLISKYHWKSKKNVINLSADSAFSFSGIGSKTNRRNWRKTFYNMFIASYTFLTPSRGLIKLLYTCLLHSFIMICFRFKKEAITSIFHLKKAKIKRKKREKDFLLHINIDSKSLTIGV